MTWEDNHINDKRARIWKESVMHYLYKLFKKSSADREKNHEKENQ
jgi:hypothetical protein